MTEAVTVSTVPLDAYRQYAAFAENAALPARKRDVTLVEMGEVRSGRSELERLFGLDQRAEAVLISLPEYDQRAIDLGSTEELKAAQEGPLDEKVVLALHICYAFAQQRREANANIMGMTAG